LEAQELCFRIHNNGEVATLDREHISTKPYEEPLYKDCSKSLKNRTDEKKFAGIINIFFCLHCEPPYNSFTYGSSSFSLCRSLHAKMSWSTERARKAQDKVLR